MTVSLLFVAGRLLFAMPIVIWAVDRVLDDATTAAVKVWAVLALGGASAVVLGLWGDVAALGLAAALVGMGVVDDREDAGADRRILLVGLVGGALCVAALYAAVGTAIDLTITDPVLDLDLR
jgi:hypothetical protein